MEGQAFGSATRPYTVRRHHGWCRLTRRHAPMPAIVSVSTLYGEPRTLYPLAMQAEIISIGTEILMGEIVDTNSAFLAGELPKIGVDLHWVTKVGDDPNRLHEAIDRARNRSDVVLTTGGLGPTTDDMTRETIARVMGEEMTVDEDLLEIVRGFFSGRGITMPETNVKQATLIPSAEAIRNPMGTAPGWWVEREGRMIVAMPGPPRELDRMWSHEVAPRLRSMNPGVEIVTRTWKTFGISEGGLNEMVAHLFESENPELGIYSKQDGIHLRAIATAPTQRDAAVLIEPMEEDIRRIAGDAIWGEDEDTPESHVAEQLARQGLTVGVIDAFTGGLISGALISVRGSERFFRGGVMTVGSDALADYDVDVDLLERVGPSTPQAADAMARAARRLTRADMGIGITEPSVDMNPLDAPPGTVYFAYASAGRTWTANGRYPDRGARNRGRAATHALLEMARGLEE